MVYRHITTRRTAHGASATVACAKAVASGLQHMALMIWAPSTYQVAVQYQRDSVVTVPANLASDLRNARVDP